jgi:hypothetical protein
VATLKRRYPDKKLVSERTVCRILRAAGLTHDRWWRSRKNGPLVELPKRSQATVSNLVWAIDFKGDFFLQYGTGIYQAGPLENSNPKCQTQQLVIGNSNGKKWRLGLCRSAALKSDFCTSAFPGPACCCDVTDPYRAFSQHAGPGAYA